MLAVKRDHVEAAYDENDRAHRWVQRIFVARNLWNFRTYTPAQERIFDPNAPLSDREG